MLVRMHEHRCNRCFAILVSFCFILQSSFRRAVNTIALLPLQLSSNQSGELISFTWHKNRRFTQQRTVVFCLTLPASIILARFRTECQLTIRRVYTATRISQSFNCRNKRDAFNTVVCQLFKKVEDSCRLRCDALLTAIELSTFRRSLSPCSRYKQCKRWN